MAKINFYLKDAKAEGETLINLLFRFEGLNFKFSTGEKISPKFWNSEAQRAKKTLQGATELNGYLEHLGETVNKIYRTAKSNNENLTVEGLKTLLLKALNKNTDKPKGFFDYFNEFIEVTRGLKQKSTINKFITMSNHLREFEKVKKFPISFASLDTRFYEGLTSYLINDKKHLNNSIGKTIAVLKTFLHWATDRGYNKNTAFLKFKIIKNDADIIYLTEPELMNMYRFDLSKNKKLDKVRDAFCFGCFTGLRFSDIGRVRKENVKNEELHISILKTKESMIIRYCSAAILE